MLAEGVACVGYAVEITHERFSFYRPCSSTGKAPKATRVIPCMPLS